MLRMNHECARVTQRAQYLAGVISSRALKVPMYSSSAKSQYDAHLPAARAARSFYLSLSLSLTEGPHYKCNRALIRMYK